MYHRPHTPLQSTGPVKIVSCRRVPQPSFSSTSAHHAVHLLTQMELLIQPSSEGGLEQGQAEACAGHKGSVDLL